MTAGPPFPPYWVPDRCWARNTDARRRAASLVEEGRDGLEDVVDAGSDVEGDRHVVGRGASGECDGVVEQALVRAGLDEQRREAVEVAEEGADERVGAGVPTRVLPGAQFERRAVEDRIEVGLGVDARAGEGEVRPRGHHERGGGHRQARSSGGQEGGEGEPSAGGLPRDGQPGWPVGVECGSVGVESVGECCGERVLRCEAVVHGQDGDAGAGGDLARQSDGLGRGPDRVPATVEVQHGRPVRLRRSGGDADGRRAAEPDVVGDEFGRART
jgi:hypothetical protein